MVTQHLQKIILEALENSKAQKVAVIDVRQLTNITDFFIICSATSTRHAKTISDKILEALHQHHIHPLSVEGEDEGEWILVDLVDVVVHIMQPETRDFYNLEKMWTVHNDKTAQPGV
jgi:ribosome-associated protein